MEELLRLLKHYRTRLPVLGAKNLEKEKNAQSNMGNSFTPTKKEGKLEAVG